MAQTINIVIIHFNTPVLTSYLIKSINKCMDNVLIYLFDNSNKLPFINTYTNVILLDNTKEELLNFKNYNLDTSIFNAGSARHALSIQYCMDNLDLNDFILMDSDIILKKNCSNFIDKSCVFSGKILSEAHRTKHVPRLLPMLCYINVKLCKQYNIKYFNNLKIPMLDDWNYDTGASFYEDARDYPHLHYNIDGYIDHLGGASYTDKNQQEFIELNEPYWSNINKFTNFVIIHYNTPKLTNALIKSIYKQMKCFHIYVLDNSDKLPLSNSYDNKVTILDNSFNKLIPELSQFKTPSTFHAKSVLYCIDTLNLDNFILLDSDVILKRACDNIVNTNYVAVGQIITYSEQYPRMGPFFLFINCTLCKKYNIKFYDPNRISESNWKYDTGASFCEDIKEMPRNEINIFNYINHYFGGSHLKDPEERSWWMEKTEDSFLNKNKIYFE